MKSNPWYYYEGTTLIKKEKPCMPDNLVHIITWQGCYKVVDVYIDHFTVIKQRTEYKIPWNHFICLKGEGKSDTTLLKRYIKTTLCKINVLAYELTNVLQDLRK